MKKTNVKSRIRKEDLNPIFHFKNKEDDDKVLTSEIAKQALKTGKLEIVGKNLKFIPENVFRLEDFNKEKKGNSIDLNSSNHDDLWWNERQLTYLDFSSNVLSKIPSEIKNLQELTVLNLQDNALTTLPEEIGSLEKLTRLNLSRNKINQLPKNFFLLRELKYLNLSFNCLTNISVDLSDLVYLETLNLSNNELESIPDGIGFLTRLTDLSLQHNKLQVLPNDITNLRNLQKLDITNNNLQLLPECMGDLRKIEFIYAQHNNIDKIPDFEGCANLQELYISNNFINEIPERFFEKLPYLKILDLRDNKITKLSDEVSMSKNLVRLDISNNVITTLPTSLCTLIHLVSLQVDGNPIKSIRRDVIACGTQRILKTLKDRHKEKSSCTSDEKLTVSSINHERQFPNKYDLKKTRSLTICGKELNEIPEQVFLDALEADISIIDLSKNKLKQLPEGLSLLKSKISELILNGNCLTNIPPFVSHFDHIKYMNVSCNQLTNLPDEIGVLTTIREINIANNKFVEFPKCIYKLINLEIIIACNNKIESIDASEEGLAALKRLATLDLSNNNLGTVPPILGNMTQITNLLLHGNSFRSPRIQILEKGTSSILSYLRDRIPKDF